MNLHRGRIQAQGGDIEESEPWSRSDPPTVRDGLGMTDKLKNKLPSKEALIREKAFEDAKKFIERAGQCGGVDAPLSKTFLVKQTKNKRVDIEVSKGKAFVK